jgi:hypothetical protein
LAGPGDNYGLASQYTHVTSSGGNGPLPSRDGREFDVNPQWNGRLALDSPSGHPWSFYHQTDRVDDS